MKIPRNKFAEMDAKTNHDWQHTLDMYKAHHDNASQELIRACTILEKLGMHRAVTVLSAAGMKAEIFWMEDMVED